MEIALKVSLVGCRSLVGRTKDPFLPNTARAVRLYWIPINRGENGKRLVTDDTYPRLFELPPRHLLKAHKAPTIVASSQAVVPERRMSTARGMNTPADHCAFDPEGLESSWERYPESTELSTSVRNLGSVVNPISTPSFSGTDGRSMVQWNSTSMYGNSYAQPGSQPWSTVQGDPTLGSLTGTMGVVTTESHPLSLSAPSNQIRDSTSVRHTSQGTADAPASTKSSNSPMKQHKEMVDELKEFHNGISKEPHRDSLALAKKLEQFLVKADGVLEHLRSCIAHRTISLRIRRWFDFLCDALSHRFPDYAQEKRLPPKPLSALSKQMNSRKTAEIQAGLECGCSLYCEPGAEADWPLTLIETLLQHITEHVFKHFDKNWGNYVTEAENVRKKKS